MLSGTVFNIQRFCTHDGPGIRTTVFLKGCPLTCWWCHNPESHDPHPEIMVMENRCVACGQCVTVCPAGEGTRQQATRAAVCTCCGRCVEVCPAEARQLAGRPLSVEEVLREVMRDRMFYEQSGGGVTFSGGEPLTKAAFLREVLAQCQGRGIHTAVDTCGFAPWDHLEAVAAVTDLFLYDLKLIDDRRHRQFTGVSNALILDNLRRLSQVHKQIWIRVPLIPGINDAAGDLQALGELIARLPEVQRVDLLPYHATALGKFARLGRAYPLGKIEPLTPEALAQAVDRLRLCGLPVRVLS
jgi:pyruvate formate lyase activating enzyme